MDFSIVVTVYNDEVFLPRCFDAILAQTIEPVEIIVVDDNSTDHTGEIIDQYEFTKIFSDEPKHETRWLNRVRAFKLAINSLQTPVDTVLKIDSDITIVPEYAATLLSHFEQDLKLAACSGIANPNQYHPLPRNGAIMYRKEAIANPEDIMEVYAWDRWTLLWLLERGYTLHVDETVMYKELRDSILTKKEAYRSGVVRRQEAYPFKAVLMQAFMQRGLRGLSFLYGYLTGSGPKRHSPNFIREYSKREEEERMRYIRRRLEGKQ